jgi:hypothetical protein
MLDSEQRARERRWVVFGEDGRYLTLGRASDPSEEEILGAEAALRAQGQGGFLAIVEGSPYAGPLPRLMEVRPLASPSATFSDAERACLWSIQARRSEAAR